MFFALLRQKFRSSHCSPQFVDHVKLLGFRKAARTWQADSAEEQVFGHLATIFLAVGIEGLKVHGFPYRSGLNIRCIKCLDQLVSGASESFFVNQKAAQPVGVEPIGCLRHKRNSWKVSKCLTVTEGDRAALFHPYIKDLQLASPNAREHVAHPVVVANFRVLECDAGIASLCSPETGFVYPFLFLSNQHPAPVVVMILFPLNEKAPTSPNVPAGISL